MKELNEMKIAELREFAEKNDIEIGGMKKKADILEAIIAATKDAIEPDVVSAEKTKLGYTGYRVVTTHSGIFLRRFADGEVIGSERFKNESEAFKAMAKL